ncbi:MAG: class I SAM-dependent methyltransferase [Candidatus Gracilibacteria bacterium]|nr:class I SAM-dependent methyltransferase [Candidatus Gracilibacteria bacterium]
MIQKDIWAEMSNKTSMEEINYLYNNPQCFHLKLKDIIEKLPNIKNGSKIIEVGSQFGVNSFVLNNDLSKTLLDLDINAIDKAKSTFLNMGKTADFVVADMFNMPFEDESFDIVFNAGVLEHFLSDDIKNALIEYKRILKNDGFIIIAIPNHYSFVYRLAYLLSNFLNKWEYPEEYKIYDLKKEIIASGLTLIERNVVCKKNIFDFWGRFQFIFKFLDRIFNFQGYLTVLIIKKD